MNFFTQVLADARQELAHVQGQLRVLSQVSVAQIVSEPVTEVFPERIPLTFDGKEHNLITVFHLLPNDHPPINEGMELFRQSLSGLGVPENLMCSVLEIGQVTSQYALEMKWNDYYSSLKQMRDTIDEMVQSEILNVGQRATALAIFNSVVCYLWGCPIRPPKAPAGSICFIIGWWPWIGPGNSLGIYCVYWCI